ncbi:MAG: hypothetical protein IPL61_28540 [Myxococcales bacterium]|nr:hypothetical protein [Myxococcales bacterium]
MTPDAPDAIATEQLLAAYADDPRALSLDERAAVEAWLAASGDDALVELRATVAEVRGLPEPGAAPDWPTLERRILAATTRAPRARWPWFAGGAALALAAAAALWLRPGAQAHAPLPFVTLAPPAPVEVAPAPTPDDELAPPAVDELLDGDDLLAADDDASDLDGLGPVDDALLDEVIALEDDDDRGDDDLPALGATWTGWIGEFSEAELDRALAWLDAQEAG